MHTNLQDLFSSFNKVKALVIGDIMVDSYVWGSASRLSPEAPVPIIAVERKENRLGGAGNVALNLQALGATPILCSIVGDDANALNLYQLLHEHKLSSHGIIRSENRITTVKTRIIGNKHQLLRVDEEQENPISAKETGLLLQKIKTLIHSDDINVVIFEDYDKGVITPELITDVVKVCNEKSIPTAVDPKKRNFTFYNGVSLFKPNLKELREGLKHEIAITDTEAIKKHVSEFRAVHNIKSVLLTLSEHGMYIQSDLTDKTFPAHIRNIADVSGAGDTVISVAALCLALKTSEKILASLSNLAGGLVCERVGVVPVDKQLLLEEATRLMH